MICSISSRNCSRFDFRPYFSNPVCAARVCCRTRVFPPTYTLPAQAVDRRVFQRFPRAFSGCPRGYRDYTEAECPMGLHAYRPLGYSLSNPSVSKNRSATLRGKSPEMERALTRDAQAACEFSLLMSKSSLQKLRCRSFDDLESEIGGFAFEIVDLQFAVLSVVKLRSSVDELHSIAQHAIDQSSQLGSHSLNGNGSPELSSQAAKLRSKIGIT